jgi:hypothetical protein
MARTSTGRGASASGGRRGKTSTAAEAGAVADSAGEPAPREAEPRRLKQAVVIVHGMGEQRPMSTLRDFVEAVWAQDPSINDTAGHPNAAQYWITPDDRTGSHELRRVVTPYVKGIRSDFYEFYWADLTQGTTRGRLYAWIRELLCRKRSEIPNDARRLYRATAVVAALFALLAVLVAVSALFSPSIAIAVALAAGLASWVLDQFALPYFGDVASYVQATPATVAGRKAVRERGLHLLRRLSNDPDYDRIVLVGHSLGSIIAYDLLQILWDERRPRDLVFPRDRPLTDTVRAVGAFAILPGDVDPAGDLTALRKAQWGLYQMLREGTATRPAWKVSDFVTVGSPLTHAEFLLARNDAALRQGIAERLFATCPPQSDKAAEAEIMYYAKPGSRAVHHGACFAATRWSNVFDLGNLLWTGDPISGSLRDNFGWGIKEFRVAIRRRRACLNPRLFTHTLYWSAGDDTDPAGEANADPKGHLAALREALDLQRSEGGTP